MMRWRLYDAEFYDEIPELGTGHVWEEEEETLTCTCYGRGKTMEDVFMPRVPHLHVLIEKQKAMDAELGPLNTRRHGRGRARLVKPSSGDVMAVGQLQEVKNDRHFKTKPNFSNDSADEALKRIAKIKDIEANERKSHKRPKIPQENPVREDGDTDPKSKPPEPIKEPVLLDNSKDEKTKPVRKQFEKPPRFIMKEQRKVQKESKTEPSPNLTENSPPYSFEPSMFFQKQVNEIQQPNPIPSQSSESNTVPEGIPYESDVQPYFFNPLFLFPNFHGFPVPNNQYLCPQVPVPNIEVPSHSTPQGNSLLFSTNTEANKLHEIPSESTKASTGVPNSFYENPYTEPGQVQLSDVKNQFVEFEQKDNETTLLTPKVPPASVPRPPFTIMPPFPYLQSSLIIPNSPYHTIPHSPCPQLQARSQVPHSQRRTVPQTPYHQSSSSVPRPPYDTRPPSPYFRPPYLFIPPSYNSPAQPYPAVYIPYPYTPNQAFTYPPQTPLHTHQQKSSSSAEQLHKQTLLLKRKDQ